MEGLPRGVLSSAPMGATLRDYRLLGLERGCTLAEVKAAFRARAKDCHPDASGGDHQGFLRLRDAYERVLALAMEGRESDGGKGPVGATRSSAKDGPARKAAAAKGRPRDDADLDRRRYKEGVEAWEDYRSLCARRADELRELERRRRSGDIAVVEVQRYRRILSELDKKAAAAAASLRESLSGSVSPDWSADAREKLEWLEAQARGLARLKAGLE